MKLQNKTQRPKYWRSKIPPPMRFQQRDAAILQKIYDFDGVLTRRQIKQIFWPSNSKQAMETRLSKLYHNGFIDWPSTIHRRTKPIPEPMIWLGWKGILHIADIQGIVLPNPSSENENQMRVLQKRLRQHGIRWVREPNWNQPSHDIAVGDFRLAVEKAIKLIPHLKLEQWIPESFFRANPDSIDFSFEGNNGKVRTKQKGICPDSFFLIVDQKRKRQRKPHHARFLLEVDMATHDNSSFGIEKAAAGAAYIHSKKYKVRFGSNSGRWLIITTSKLRMRNLMIQTARKTKNYKNLFFFTTLDQLSTNNILIDPIWSQPNQLSQKPLPFSQ